MTWTFIPSLILFVLWPFDNGHAQAPSPTAPNVFAAALIDGHASAPIEPGSVGFSRMLSALRDRAPDGAPAVITADRVLRFAQQPRCGRVRFMLVREQGTSPWRGVVGQMNVCEDGQPPLRTCPERPGILVPGQAACPSGKPPIDTAEVSAAIADAVADGALTNQQMLRRWDEQLRARAASQPVAPSASPAKSKVVSP